MSKPRTIDRPRIPRQHSPISLSSTPHSISSRRQSMAKLGSTPLLDSKLRDAASIHSGGVLIDAENPSFANEVKDEEQHRDHMATYYLNPRDSMTSEGGDILHLMNKPKKQEMKKVKSSSNLIEAMEGKRRKQSASGLNVPGGFRREFILKKKKKAVSEEELAKVPFLTRNFMEFLYIYGHFAGENFLEDFEYPDSLESQAVEDETTSLLGPRGKPMRKYEAQGTTSTMKAFLIMLKSFIGTGVIFLPKGFSNGGLLFSICMLLVFGIYSYYCYYILIMSKTYSGVSSFGDIGSTLYGSHMKSLILTSLILTQIGFACAYVIFTAENLSAFMRNIGLPLPYQCFFILQAIVFIPLSFIRNVSKLSVPSLVANTFILVGIFIILSYLTTKLVTDGVAHPINLIVNGSSFSLFIGTAIFAFEGIGLIIPIQNSMRHPEKFPMVLAFVIMTITVLMVTVATVGYLAYGEEVKTAVLLNLPQSDRLVQLIQLFYSVAILLSTPLQLFPAIAIIQNFLFGKPIPRIPTSENNSYNSTSNSDGMIEQTPEPLSGKSNPKVKWAKNFLRTMLVLVCIIIAWFAADELDKFVSFVGCFACIPLVYLYPPLLHLKCILSGKKGVSEDNEVDETGFNEGEKIRAWIIDGSLVVIGLFCMSYNSYQIMFG